MASTSTSPSSEPPLSPSILQDVYNLWFEHIPSNQNLTLPTPPDFKPWFTKDSTFDKTCQTQFLPTLEAIKPTTATHLLNTLTPQTPKDWLSLILLLDQLPRNCYRGASSATVFTVFDPLALEIAQRAISQRIPVSPDIRFRLGLRMWFYLPLMHSEDLAVQDQCREMYVGMAEDVARAGRGEWGSGLEEGELECVKILWESREAAEGICAYNRRFQEEHRDIIVRFGRYPHRNGVLGRESTPEEVRFLEEENVLG